MFRMPKPTPPAERIPTPPERFRRSATSKHSVTPPFPRPPEPPAPNRALHFHKAHYQSAGIAEGQFTALKMDTEYLKNTVGDALTRGCAVTATVRPADSVEYLANWLQQCVPALARLKPRP